MTLSEFEAAVRCTEARKANRSQDYCEWHFGKVYLFHERINGAFSGRIKPFGMTPGEISHIANTPLSSEYWGDTIYKDLQLAESDARQYNAKVQKGWYCDDNDPYWFLIFRELNDAIRQSYDQLVKQGTI